MMPTIRGFLRFVPGLAHRYATFLLKYSIGWRPQKKFNWEKIRLRKDPIEKRSDWEKFRLRKDPIEKRSDWESLQMITTVNYNRRAGQSGWSNPGGQNSELSYNVIAPMMADAELPSRVMQPQASSTSSGNLRRSFSWVNSPLKDCKKQSDSQVTIW